MRPFRKLTEGNSLFLDALRAVAAQLVVIGRGISFCRIAGFLQPPNFPYIQNIAVVVFFMLSGFVISNSIFKNTAADPSYSFRSYFIDRFSRIYTALVPALFFVLALDYASAQLSLPGTYAYSAAFNLKTFLGNIFMLQNFPLLGRLHLDIPAFSSARPLWTLAIEWWLYLWFGYFLLTIVKEKRSILAMLVFVFLSIVPAFQLASPGNDGPAIFWLFGVLLAVLYESYSRFPMSRRLKSGLLLALMALALFRVIRTMQEYDAIFAFLLAGCFLIGLELCSTMSFNRNSAAIIRLVAGYSYTLYLIHYSIYDFIAGHLRGVLDPYTLFLFGFFISNIFAFVIGYFTETKLTRRVRQELRKRFASQ